MFGYVRVAPPALDSPSFKQYQGVYCSLCRQLGRRYGLLARFILNYDLTFLALLKLAVKQQDCRFVSGHCSFSPLCRRLCCHEEETLAETADISVLLTYYKLTDNAADEHGLKRLICRLLLKACGGWYRKAKERQPQTEALLADYMRQQATVEAARTASVDAAADPFARFLAALLTAVGTDEAFYRFGYCLGRWIYLADAVDDLPDDAASGSYNPYAAAHGLDIQSSPQTVREVQEGGLLHLNNCLAVCRAAYDALPVRRFDPVFRNVLYAGMPAVQKELLLTKRERRQAARQLRSTRKKRDV